VTRRSGGALGFERRRASRCNSSGSWSPMPPQCVAWLWSAC